MYRSLSCCIAELSLPPGVVFDWIALEAICLAVSMEVDIPSTCNSAVEKPISGAYMGSRSTECIDSRSIE